MISDREFPFECTGRRSRRFHQGNENARTRSVDEQRRLVEKRINANSRASKNKKKEKKRILAWHSSNQSILVESIIERRGENNLILNPKKKKRKKKISTIRYSMPIHNIDVYTLTIDRNRCGCFENGNFSEWNNYIKRNKRWNWQSIKLRTWGEGRGEQQQQSDLHGGVCRLIDQAAVSVSDSRNTPDVSVRVAFSDWPRAALWAPLRVFCPDPRGGGRWRWFTD